MAIFIGWHMSTSFTPQKELTRLDEKSLNEEMTLNLSRGQEICHASAPTASRSRRFSCGYLSRHAAIQGSCTPLHPDLHISSIRRSHVFRHHGTLLHPRPHPGCPVSFACARYHGQPYNFSHCRSPPDVRRRHDLLRIGGGCEREYARKHSVLQVSNTDCTGVLRAWAKAGWTAMDGPSPREAR